MPVTKTCSITIALLIACYWVPIFISLPASANSTSTRWSLEQRTPYNVEAQRTEHVQYTPLTQALKPWKICALMPHLKDAYWIGIDYGLVLQAKKLNITLELFEAGGYYAKDKQLAQLSACMTGDYDAILLGSVDPKLLSFYAEPITKPIIALVNRIDNDEVHTRIGVSWYQMGVSAGNFIKQDIDSKRKQGTQQAFSIALLTGPDHLGGADSVEHGAMAALFPEVNADIHATALTQDKDSIVISSIRHADNNRNLYRDQLHYLLKDQTPDYILGSAIAIEVAMGELVHQKLHLTNKPIELVSSYLSPVVLRGLFRQKVAFSNDDQVVLQGMLAIDVVVKELQGNDAFGDIGPKIKSLKQDVLEHTGFKKSLNFSLAPAEFYPVYRVNSP